MGDRDIQVSRNFGFRTVDFPHFPQIHKPLVNLMSRIVGDYPLLPYTLSGGWRRDVYCSGPCLPRLSTTLWWLAGQQCCCYECARIEREGESLFTGLWPRPYHQLSTLLITPAPLFVFTLSIMVWFEGCGRRGVLLNDVVTGVYFPPSPSPSTPPPPTVLWDSLFGVRSISPQIDESTKILSPGWWGARDSQPPPRSSPAKATGSAALIQWSLPLQL